MKILMRTALLPLVSFFGMQVASAATVDRFYCSIRVYDENQVIVGNIESSLSGERRSVSSQEGIEMTEASISLTAKVPVVGPFPDVPPGSTEPIPVSRTASQLTDDSTLTVHYRHALETHALGRENRAAQTLCFTASRAWKGNGEATACVGADSDPFAPNSYGWTKAGVDNGVVLFEPSQLRRGRLILGNPSGARSEYQCRYAQTVHTPSN